MNQKSFLLIMFFILYFTGCQFNTKISDENNKLKFEKIGATNFYMHNYSGIKDDTIDIYVDNKKVNLEILDISGIELNPGKHSVDVKNSSTKKLVDHFEFDVQKNEDKHIYLCKDPKIKGHYNLSERADENCKK